MDPLSLYQKFLEIERGTDIADDHPAKVLYNKIEYIHSSHLYGVLEEIGANTPIQTLLFSVSGASKTIKQAQSSYAKSVQTQMYGNLQRSVSKASVLTFAHAHIEELLNKESSLSFALAFSGSTSSSPELGGGDNHGWMALALEDGSSYVLHMRMLAGDRPTQQITVGIIGINLLYQIATNGSLDHPEELLTDIYDYAHIDVVIHQPQPNSEEDMFDHVLRNVQLAYHSTSPLVTFVPAKGMLQCERYLDVLRDKKLLVHKGAFNPPTKAHEAMVQTITDHYSINYTPLFEISVENADKGRDTLEHLAHRVMMLGMLGYPVVLTKRPTFFETKELFEKETKAHVDFLCGEDLYARIFMEKYYENLEGGLGEGLERLFTHETKLYVFGRKESKDIPKNSLRFVDQYSEHIEQLPFHFEVSSTAVRQGIAKNKEHWKENLREDVTNYIETHHLYEK